MAYYVSPEIQNLHISAVCEALNENIGKLYVKDQDFAKSLCALALKYGLTGKQAEWARILLQRAYDGPKVLKTLTVGSLQHLYNLFEVAKKHLKKPAILLSIPRVTEDGDVETDEVKIFPASMGGKNAGKLYVTDGKPYGQNKFYGSVDAQGDWIALNHNGQVKDLLEAMSKDPAGTAKEHATLTGRCCFCNHKLTDERSTAVGFGPDCAKHYNLTEAWKQGVSLWEAMKSKEKEIA